MKKKVEVEKVVVETAEAKQYNWADDPIGYADKFPAIAKTMELGETVGEKVRMLGTGLTEKSSMLKEQIATEGDWMGPGSAGKPQNVVVSGDFTAAAKFDGPRKGYVFTNGDQGKGYYLKTSDDDKYVVKPGLFTPLGVEKGAESAAGEKYWTYAVPFLGKNRRGEKQVNEGGRFAFFDVFKETPTDTPEQKEAAEMRKAFEARVKKEKKEAEEEVPLETGVISYSPDPRDVLKQLGPIDRAPQVVKAELEAKAKAEAEKKAKADAEAKAKAEAEKAAA